MFRSIRPQQLKGKLQEINCNLASSIENAAPLKKSIENFIGETELEGNAYMTQKEYMKEGHLPAIEAQVSVEELLKEANEKYIGYIDTYFSNETYLNEDLLQLQITTLTASKYTTNPAVLFFIKDTINARIEECRTKLANMNSFIEETNGLYEDVKIQIDVAKGKITNIENSIYNCDTGMYYMPSATTELPVSKEDFINDMKNQYGFDDKTGEIMYDVYTKLKAKYPNASQTEIDWRFTRLMGGLIYDHIDDLNSALWNQTAGSVTDNEKEYFTSELGLSETDYNYLKYKVRVQPGIANGTYKTYQDICDDEDIDAEACKKNLLAAFGITEEYLAEINMTEDEFFEKEWNKQYEDMKEKGDYAHQQIITATIFATKLNEEGYIANAFFLNSDESREDYSGWLGDCTLANPWQQPSLGPDDYIADLDAENITYIMKKEGKSYLDAQKQYYSELGNKYTRADKFLEHTSLDEVRKTIYGKSSPLPYESQTKEHVDKVIAGTSPQAYNFIKSLEEGSNTLIK